MASPFNRLEKSAREAARAAGLVARKSRKRLGSVSNHGGFCLLDDEARIVAGTGFSLTPADVVKVSARWRSLLELTNWMAQRGWQPLPHQWSCWRAQLDRQEGLLCVPTGSGKTYAAYFAGLAGLLAEPSDGLRVLWLAPMRAMANDLEAALKAPADDLGLAVTVASRTGDTSAYRKRKLRDKLPNVLVTTPESLTLMLSYEDAAEKFASVALVVVDEWHELLGSKRGTQTELALARLRKHAPGVLTWGLSATVGELEESGRVLLGPKRPLKLVTAEQPAAVAIHTLPVPEAAHLPWFGFLGAAMFDAVVEDLDGERSTLLFTNTRNQAEQWYRAIMQRRPEWFPISGVHHGAIDQKERQRIEAGLASGAVRLVVCTSSFDLGIDFSPVERVFQIGSPRGIARLLQRAGRAGHRPGVVSEINLVPTHAMQLVEFAALRRALANGTVEHKRALVAPLDVLIQHLMTCAAAGGFDADGLWNEVRTTWAYQELDRESYEWALRFLVSGGSALENYEHYHRLRREPDGGYRLKDAAVGRAHRLAIGTITSNNAFRVRFKNGRELGTMEEAAVARLRPGDRFLFAGRALELVMTRGDDVFVRTTKSADHAPKWLGDELPFSAPLTDATVAVLDDVRRHVSSGTRELAMREPELRGTARLFALQARVSKIPSAERLLLEHCSSADHGSHLFLFTFAGHAANRVLASLLAWRLSRDTAVTFALTANEYAFELHTPERFAFAAALSCPELFQWEALEAHAREAINAAELGRRQFRRIARVAGLLHEGLPTARKSARQLQTSAALLYDVFDRHEPDNRLLKQAQAEVLDRHFELNRVRALLERLQGGALEVVETERPSPMAFPLTLERAAGRLSTETGRRRLERMQQEWAAAMAGS